MKTKKRFNRNQEISKIIGSVLAFAQWCGIILRNNDEYGDNTYRKRQLTKMLVMNFLTLLTAIRFLLTAAIAEEWIVVLMSDSLYLLSVSKQVESVSHKTGLVDVRHDSTNYHDAVTVSAQT